MARLIPAFLQFFDDNGDPLVDGLLKFVESGTNNTDKDTFADINESIANTNPVELDGAGRCPNVFGSGSYNVISYTSSMVQIQQFDPVSGDSFEGAFSDWNSVTIYGEGDLVIASDGLYYRSIVANNQNQDPTVSPTQWEEVLILGVWNTTIVYSIGDGVYGSDGFLYISRTNSNSGNDPISDLDNWEGTRRGRDIQPVTASVAANALTVGLNPAVLDFRSVTLTDGIPLPRVVGASLSLIVPSGATLGSAGTVASTQVLIAIDYVGTVELAIINLAGGNNLDETTLITTVAMSATADLDNVFYSTTARTSVAFRVVGYVASTQPVAGVWDTAPSLVQGGGGNSLIPLIGSFGNGQAWTSLTGSRSAGVTYYNTTSKPIMVIIENTTNTIGGFIMNVTVGGVVLASTQNYASTATNYRDVVSFVVPVGVGYVATVTNSLISKWVELR